MIYRLFFILPLLSLVHSWEEQNIDLVPCQDKHCQTCDYTTQNATCIQCQQHYYIDDLKNICQLCTQAVQHCDRCQNNNQTVKCTQCLSGYYLFETSCQLCNEVIEGCNQCKYTSEVVCNSCSDSYYLKIGQCKRCSSAISECYSCRAANNQAGAQCISCIGVDNWPTDDFMSCKQCSYQIENCIKCSRQFDTAHLSCITCKDGYDLEDMQCTISHTLQIVVGVVGGLLIIAIIFTAWRRMHRKKKHSTLLQSSQE